MEWIVAGALMEWMIVALIVVWVLAFTLGALKGFTIMEMLWLLDDVIRDPFVVFRPRDEKGNLQFRNKRDRTYK